MDIMPIFNQKDHWKRPFYRRLSQQSLLSRFFYKSSIQIAMILHAFAHLMQLDLITEILTTRRGVLL